MHDPDPKCRHFGILWQFMAFLPKSRIGNQIRFFRFFPIFRLFPTFRFHSSTREAGFEETALQPQGPNHADHVPVPLSNDQHPPAQQGVQTDARRWYATQCRSSRSRATSVPLGVHQQGGPFLLGPRAGAG